MEKDIGKIKKNDETEIVIRIDDFGGRKGLTIREFVTSERYTGFTKSGVRISAGDFQSFKEMINSITEEDLAEEPSTEEASVSSEPASEVPKEQTTLDSEKETSNEELPDY